MVHNDSNNKSKAVSPGDSILPEAIVKVSGWESANASTKTSIPTHFPCHKEGTAKIWIILCKVVIQNWNYLNIFKITFYISFFHFQTYFSTDSTNMRKYKYKIKLKTFKGHLSKSHSVADNQYPITDILSWECYATFFIWWHQDLLPFTLLKILI